ncbi:BLUF domain-containing protein [Nocardioides zeae]|uniref:BLUF domain-containing protein n=1 Tax=Nocardioides imazamoxiresistens TaxID=3231893 RepID=A0ABU3PRW5_9ACTN|nr:BLUF domain-containing protein [Nocardioides zeae]MDT9591963.1 BLUF domain-containing protein [Nocardioides zeae]
MLSLTYLSSSARPWDPADLESLLRRSRAANEAAGLTGALLYWDGNFVQTLEGPAPAVRQTFGRISVDPRHRGVFIVLREEVEVRAFEGWSMGFREVDGDTAAGLPGFTDYLRTGRRLGLGGDESNAEVFHRVFRDAVR